MPRQYEDLWNTIKYNYANGKKSTVVTCVQENSKNIIRMVSKEKNMDNVWPVRPYLKLTHQILPEKAQGYVEIEFKLVLFRSSELIPQLI